MAILHSLQIHFLRGDCVSLSWVLLSLCSDAQTAGWTSCVRWAVFGFALVVED